MDPEEDRGPTEGQFMFVLGRGRVSIATDDCATTSFARMEQQ